MCGVSQSTSNDALLNELNLSKLKRFWCKQSIQFWNGLLSPSAPTSSLHKAVLLDNVVHAVSHRTKNFSSSLCLFLRKVGHTLDLQPQRISIVDLSQVLLLLEHQDNLLWSNLSPNPHTAPKLHAKLCTYHNWFRPLSSTNPFSHLPVSGKRMKRFLRFRLSCHSLPIETGRRVKPFFSHHCRFFTHCTASVGGDEKNFMFKCEYLQAVRAKYYFLFTPLSNTVTIFSPKTIV